MPVPSIAGDVLVPKGNIVPNLGLMPPPKPAIADDKKKEEEKKAEEKDNADEKALNAQMKVPAYTPPPSDKLNLSSPEILGNRKQKKKSHPTFFIRLPDYVEPQEPGLPNSIAISFSDKSTISDIDAKRINKRLGLTRKEISTNCYIAPTGLLYTSKDRYIFGHNLSHISTVRYDGTITEYSLRAKALCKPNATVPSNAGPLVMINDRVQVILRKADCPAPTRPVKSLLVTYTGAKDGTATCEYRY